MKRGVRITLASICAVIIAICCVALGLYTFDYMGFEDGKLKFYFDKNINNSEDPNTPDNPEDPTPDEPIENGKTIHLIWADKNKSSDYVYDPEKTEFNPAIQNTWLKIEERNKDYYRFDGWYKDSAFSVPVNSGELKDGDVVYAKMIKQVSIYIYASDPRSTNSNKDVRVDYGSEVDIKLYLEITVADLLGIYTDKQKTQKFDRPDVFNATENLVLYLDWSTLYMYFTFEINGDSATITGCQRTDLYEIKVPSLYRENMNIAYPITSIKDSFNGPKIWPDVFGYPLRRVYLPNTITEIENCFGNLDNLESVTILALEPPRAGNLFSGRTSDKRSFVIYVPSSVTGIYMSSSYWRSFTIKSIPE